MRYLWLVGLLLAGCVGHRISQQELDERSVAIICGDYLKPHSYSYVGYSGQQLYERCRYNVLYEPKVPGPRAVCTTRDGTTTCTW